ncbi:heme exporter protein CcmD [Aquabacterium sp. OR-4]|uniref:heme exporter protein CcmD n=1 Tax=Aquabacterium sp. OR-4 TaxID=2978127 RepID=UPI0028C519DE|nr:heme exporter protein CcmD [Aquabacterium sp. OR-4]MDT7838711.1 heme exporter protein CcmD [Aquabacterium sp. OR-4]
MPDWLNTLLTPWWPDLAAFARMGRHGAYVWPTVALTALALAAEWAWLRREQAEAGLAQGPEARP